ncbi:Pyruvate kinase [Liberibacter crescens BT-1]|uniref:Pyruvate kinase n=1 Tax=Liberibacter crescens (strain BT-1) TaxID=1215343 RepID=L0ETH1_LIBCB|nr:pyruvate kinase [Liberibacter crescens]AGA64120.1 Pyruvate kinase [Liberibacter crescens BT-1]AMC12397.1 pyruvate kinase [Liberibacter crescens]
MRSLRKVKIVATLGPASFSEEVVDKLHQEGADLFRINMSHASHDMMYDFIKKIRSVESRHGYPIGIIVDLQGPKFRVGKFDQSKIMLTSGQIFTLDKDSSPGDINRVHFPHPEVFKSIEIGHRLLIDDGKLVLRVRSCNDYSITCEVISGTSISDRKGVSLPDTLLSVSVLTEKDMIDLDVALQTGEVDWIALSFIQDPESLIKVRKITQGRVGLLAKIEKPQAVKCIEEIIKLSDAIMIARGDLGVEMPIESVPGIQKKIIHISRMCGKPVVVATQMLESMVSAPVPTRAEVSDVATAVFEGADAIMLSSESASGNYPIEAIRTMACIASSVEIDPWFQYNQKVEPDATGADAISLAARQIAETLHLSAIVCYTSSGATGLRAARERPQIPILALSPIMQTARRLSLSWGLYCVVTEDATDLDDMVNRACRVVVSTGFGKPGDRIIISAGFPLGTPGATNMLRIAYIGTDGLSGV